MKIGDIVYWIDHDYYDEEDKADHFRCNYGLIISLDDETICVASTTFRQRTQINFFPKDQLSKEKKEAKLRKSYTTGNAERIEATFNKLRSEGKI